MAPDVARWWGVLVAVVVGLVGAFVVLVVGLVGVLVLVVGLVGVLVGVGASFWLVMRWGLPLLLVAMGVRPEEPCLPAVDVLWLSVVMGYWPVEVGLPVVNRPRSLVVLSVAVSDVVPLSVDDLPWAVVGNGLSPFVDPSDLMLPQIPRHGTFSYGG